MSDKLDDKFKEAVTKKMASYANENDCEAAHSQMDDLLIEVLRYHGYDEAADTYDAQTKWCA